MKTIIASDIFGITTPLKAFANSINPSHLILSPYDDSELCFEDEATAYQYFSKHSGVEPYADKLITIIRQQQQPVKLIGFSAGASAIWLSLNEKQLPIQAAWCFYSSQIRHHITIKPQYPTKVIFPKSEPHFCVNEMITALSQHQHLQLIKEKGLHGFINPLSINFNASLANKYQGLLKAEI